MTTGQKPEFSIITVVRNSVDTIENCVKSVKSQTHKDYEYIVIDGLSDDGTSEIILKHLDSINVYLREKDAGIYDAMNKALTLCSGKYIGIINADDSYLPDTLSNVHRVFTDFPNAQVVYGGVHIVSEKGGLLFIDHLNLDNYMIAHPSCFVSAEVYRNFGKFNSNFKIAADYDFMLRIRNAGVTFKNSGLVLANYRPGGASAKYRFVSIKEMINIQAYHLGWSNLYRKYKFFRHIFATYLKYH